MIHGTLQQHDFVDFLSRNRALAIAFDWIRSLPRNPPEGIVELQGHRLYGNIHSYTTKLRQDCTWESHRRTADLQLCLHGSELIDWTPLVPGRAESYDTKKDFETWPAGITATNTIRLTAGSFAIFLPEELHRPMIAASSPAHLHKLVVKINAALLSKP